jgi:transposase
LCFADVIELATSGNVQTVSKQEQGVTNMTLLTAEQAAKKLGRTERTVRRWITGDKKGEGKKLKAVHPGHGHTSKWLIEESEVERLAQELAQEQALAEQAEPTAATKQATLTPFQLNHILERLADLEIKTGALEKLYLDLQRTIGSTEPPEPRAAEPHLPTRTATKRATEPTEPPEDLPPGSLRATAFAKKYGINPRTFRDHIDRGYIPAHKQFKRMKKNGPEHERWLSPEQQEQALRFEGIEQPPAEDQATEASHQEAHSADF